MNTVCKNNADQEKERLCTLIIAPDMRQINEIWGITEHTLNKCPQRLLNEKWAWRWEKEKGWSLQKEDKPFSASAWIFSFLVCKLLTHSEIDTLNSSFHKDKWHVVSLLVMTQFTGLVTESLYNSMWFCLDLTKDDAFLEHSRHPPLGSTPRADSNSYYHRRSQLRQ